ncbi:N-methyl-L-tryptophan oxidase [Streptomyces shenzhenensis]|uniref:N-methyl-L-tryptophan oxidase n=1 Tax=Streptomyces shenzhenensis TaxID=943815 RepID=UPI003D9275F2
MRGPDTDAVVVGLGIHGSAAAFELARRGIGVLGLDQFEEGHHRGSSHGRTRMIRRAYPNPVWNDFVARAFDGWERWSEAGGETLIRTTGGLYAHQGVSQLQGPGCESVEDPGRMRELMPSFAVPAGYRAVYDPSAGVVEAAAAVEVARSGARAAGAELSFGERMLSWTRNDGGVVVTTDRRVVRARHLVLTVGAWAGRVLTSLSDLFEVWRIVTVTLRPGQSVAVPPALGAFSVDRPEGLVFGIPDAAGNGFKAGVDAGPVWDPAEPTAPPTEAEVAALVELMTGYVPGVDPDVVEAASCLYTMTADRRFVIGRLPAEPEVIVAAACSGHGFKFGPAVGESVADLVTGVDRADLSFIGVGRRVRR